MGTARKLEPADWTYCQKEYEEGRMTMKQLAAKFGVSRQAISDYAKRTGGWKTPAWLDEGKVTGKYKMASQPNSLLDGQAKAVKPDKPDIARATPGQIALWDADKHKSAILDANEDGVMSMITLAMKYETIAENFTCSVTTLMRWLDATEERKDLVTRARQASTYTLSDKVIEAIDASENILDLSKAREKAQHYRWLASAMNPKFNPKQQVEITGSIRTEASDEELNKRLAELLPTIDVETKLIE